MTDEKRTAIVYMAMERGASDGPNSPVLLALFCARSVPVQSADSALISTVWVAGEALLSDPAMEGCDMTGQIAAGRYRKEGETGSEREERLRVQPQYTVTVETGTVQMIRCPDCGEYMFHDVFPIFPIHLCRQRYQSA